MTEEGLLQGKKILIVDDEPDVIETLEELLQVCKISRAPRFEDAKKLLESEQFDIAILDIMGVRGYELLDIAVRRNVIPVMLTAHALSVDDTVKSFRRGAASYIPKDEIARIAVFLNDILEAEEKGRKPWWRWMERLGTYYERKFGSNWRERDKEFWDKYNFYS
jgi:DNA-binding NtrC family response regulator